MSFWTSLWQTRAQSWTYAELESPSGPRTPVPPGGAYLSLFLKSARVTDVRRGLSRFYGAVHSYVKLAHRSTGEAEFNMVIAPDMLRDIDARNVDRVLVLDQRLLGPVPYVGGDVELEIGLFSIQSADLAAPYLKLLESLSSAAGVSYFAAALPFAKPILDGIQLLTGGNDASILELGLSKTERAPKTGYVVVVRAPKGSIDVSNLRVDPTDFTLLDRRGGAISDFPYLVLELTAQRERDDWALIPELRQAYAHVQQSVRAGKWTDAKAALAAFKLTAWTCNDLLLDDAERLAKEVEATIAPLLRAPIEAPPLDSLRLFAR